MPEPMNTRPASNAPQSTQLFNQMGLTRAGSNVPGGSTIAYNSDKELTDKRRAKYHDHLSKNGYSKVDSDNYKNDAGETVAFHPGAHDGNPLGHHVTRTFKKVVSGMEPSTVEVPPQLEFAVPADRMAIINRILRATGLADAISSRTPMRVSKFFAPLQIRQRQFDDHDFRINAPYGLMGLALNANEEQLIKMCDYCERKKKEFMHLGDWERARLFGNRQDMVRGILTHLTRYKLL